MGPSDGMNNPGAENSRVSAPHEKNVPGVNLRQELLLRDRVETEEIDLIGKQPGISLYFAPIFQVGFRIADSAVLMMVYGGPDIVMDSIQSLLVRELESNGCH